MKEAFIIFALIMTIWMLEADYRGKVVRTAIPSIFRTHSGYEHK